MGDKAILYNHTHNRCTPKTVILAVILGTVDFALMSAPDLSELLISSGMLSSEASVKLDAVGSLFRGIRLTPGQIFARAGDVPRWVGIVISGTIRQTFSNGEQSSTISKFSRGQIICASEVIRGSSRYSFNATEDVSLYVMASASFLQLIAQDLVQEQVYTHPTLAEVFETLYSSQLSSGISTDALLHFCRATLKCDSNLISIRNIPPDDIRADSSSTIIASSANIKEYPVGAALSDFSPALSVNEKLPARFILYDNSLLQQLHSLKVQEDNSSAAESHDPNPSITSGSANTGLFHLSDIEAEADLALREWYGLESSNRIPPSIAIENLNDKSEVTIAILRLASQYFNIPYKRDTLEQAIAARIAENNDAPLNTFSYATLLDLIGVRSDIVDITPNSISRVCCPCLYWDNQSHVGILWDINTSNAVIWDGGLNPTRIPLSELLNRIFSSSATSSILCLTPSSDAKTQRFGLSWFLPAIKSYKTSLVIVVVTSFFVQLLAVFNPLLIQQIIDAVITQGNITSLNVYGTLLVAMALSEGILSTLRTFLLSDTTNRIDLSLGALVIDHLIRLPLSYFSKRPVGEVSSRVNELEKIREFLTGTGLSSILDAFFSIVYIAVMASYSVPLTLWSLSVIPLFVILAITFAPIIRRQVESRSRAYAKVQSHLVESLGGIETIKTQNLEFQTRWQWRKNYNKQISESFKNSVTLSSAGSISKFLEQLSGLIVIWVGASLVLKSELTIGQLIAFRILSGYVTGPILRLATLWQNFQETGVSIQRLGDVINTPTESEIHGDSLIPLPPIQGKVEYKNVDFRFRQFGPPQLSRVSLSIASGTFVGIVGGSGSGKSTLVKLLTGLYKPNSGIIKIDGYDISKVDLYSLRSQVGIVPQDSLLFDGTIRENVAISRPQATLEEIQHAIKIACAEDFVSSLPLGLSSSVGERGSALSGGQRQRIAIARMVVAKPRLVILDEATSALDVNTERMVLRNLTSTLSDTTILFITHRISTLKDADCIVVMDSGMVDEVGTHEQLIHASGRYSALLQQQFAEGLL